MKNLRFPWAEAVARSYKQSSEQGEAKLEDAFRAVADSVDELLIGGPLPDHLKRYRGKKISFVEREDG